MDMMTGSTYYTFVDSGAFTVNYSSISHVDEQGIQLSFGGPFSINNSTLTMREAEHFYFDTLHA